MYTKYKTGSMPSETRLFYRLQLIIQHGVSPHTRIYHSHRQEARSLFLSYGGQLPWIGSAFMIEKMESDLSNQHFRLLFCCPTNFSLSSFDLHRSQYQIHYVYYRAHIVLYTITFPSSTVKYSYNYFLQSTGAGFFFLDLHQYIATLARLFPVTLLHSHFSFDVKNTGGGAHSPHRLRPIPSSNSVDKIYAGTTSCMYSSAPQ